MAVYHELVVERDGRSSLVLRGGAVREWWKSTVDVASNVGAVEIYAKGRYVGCIYERGWVHKVKRYRLVFSEGGYVRIEAEVDV